MIDAKLIQYLYSSASLLHLSDYTINTILFIAKLNVEPFHQQVKSNLQVRHSFHPT